MQAIQTLRGEHAALRQVLAALEQLLDRQRERDQLDAELALEALEWLEHFADGLHQDREELGLFPCLERRVPLRTRRVLDYLVRWHGEERRQLAELRARIEGAAYGDALSGDAFALAGRAYIEQQRRHADLEDALLLPLALEVLAPEDEARIAAQWARLEPRHVRAGELGALERAQRLCARCAQLAAPLAPSAPLAGSSPRRAARGSEAAAA